MTTMKNTILAFCSFILLASCGAMKSKVGTAQVSLDNSSWKVTENVKGNAPTLVMDAGRISGNAGCNNYFSTQVNIDPTAGNFSVKNIGSTRKMCENMDVESTYLKMLDETTNYIVKDNTLELYKGNLLLLRFTKM